MIQSFSLLSLQLQKKEKGFTLIEVLVVVSIIALMSMLVIPSLSSYLQISLNATAREMASTAKEVYNSAIVTGKMYRLVYDLKTNEYWAESGPGIALLETANSRKIKEEKKGTSKKETKESNFQQDMVISPKKKALPRGVSFEDITNEQQPEPITEGLAFTHFFPHGITEPTILHLKDQSNHQITLVIQGLTGVTDLHLRYVPAQEIFKNEKK